MAIPHICSDGQESGTGGTVQTAVPGNGALVIDHLLSAPAEGAHVGVYVSSADGGMLFLQDVVSVDTFSLRLPLLADGSRRCLTNRLLPFGAVLGLAVRNRNDMGLCSNSPRGLVKADADDGGALSSDDPIALRNAQVAEAMVREQDGLRQLVMSLHHPWWSKCCRRA